MHIKFEGEFTQSRGVNFMEKMVSCWYNPIFDSENCGKLDKIRLTAVFLLAKM